MFTCLKMLNTDTLALASSSVRLTTGRFSAALSEKQTVVCHYCCECEWHIELRTSFPHLSGCMQHLFVVSFLFPGVNAHFLHRHNIRWLPVGAHLRLGRTENSSGWVTHTTDELLLENVWFFICLNHNNNNKNTMPKKKPPCMHHWPLRVS